MKSFKTLNLYPKILSKNIVFSTYQFFLMKKAQYAYKKIETKRIDLYYSGFWNILHLYIVRTIKADK